MRTSRTRIEVICRSNKWRNASITFAALSILPTGRFFAFLGFVAGGAHPQASDALLAAGAAGLGLGFMLIAISCSLMERAR